MDWSACEGAQAPLNHSVLKYVPKPKEPAASEVTSMSVGADIPGNNQKLTPCQETKNSCHHCTSSWNSEFKRMGWSRVRKQQRRSIMRCKNVSPGHTTFTAWWRWPISDSSWRLVHHRLDHQDWINSCKLASFSAGRRADCSIESNSIPKTTRQVAGPMHLPG